MGFLALVLFAWDYQNNRVVASVGMGWDTGPPIWPYRVVPLLSYALNVPAYIASWPILKVLDLRTLTLQYAVWVPAIVLLWWWVGIFADFGILGVRRHTRLGLLAAILLTGTIGLVIAAGIVGLGEYRWFRDYWQGHSPIFAALFLRSAGPMVWCLVVAGALGRSAIRVLRREPPPSSSNLKRFRALLFCIALLGLDATAVAYLDRVFTPPIDPNACEADRLYRLGCVHGTVIDENKGAVSHIEVNLIPTSKTGDARWYGTESQWTDEQGRYNFNRTESGVYILAVNSFERSAGPDEERPFATVYYPGAKDQSGAEPVAVNQPSATNLFPVIVHRLRIASIRVTVLWEDGSRPERSNIALHNTRYFGILSPARQVDNGSGETLLPEGFEYEATADVQCDAGKVIEQRESKPEKRFMVAGGSTPAQLTFVIPGPRCVLWEPK